MHLTPSLYVAIVACLLLLLVAKAIQFRINVLARQIAVVSRIEAKLDLLLKQAGLTYDPYKNASPAVVDAVKRGAKIEAIKLYRQETSVGLKEAKDYVEGLQRHAGLG